jgi:hypothetical protein
MEASMHGSFDKQPNDDQNTDQGWSMKLVALPLLAVVALIGMVLSHPAAIGWISDAGQAEFVGSEFVGTDMVPDLAPPTRTAQPTNEVRSVKAY